MKRFPVRLTRPSSNFSSAAHSYWLNGITQTNVVRGQVFWMSKNINTSNASYSSLTTTHVHVYMYFPKGEKQDVKIMIAWCIPVHKMKFLQANTHVCQKSLQPFFFGNIRIIKLVRPNDWQKILFLCFYWLSGHQKQIVAMFFFRFRLQEKHEDFLPYLACFQSGINHIQWSSLEFFSSAMETWMLRFDSSMQHPR